MTRRATQPRSRADFRSAPGALVVMREAPPTPARIPGYPAPAPVHPEEGPEILLAVWDDGSITALCGHVDLGTGIQTALAQLVAEELDANFEDVCVMLGHTARVPNQGATIASSTIQIHAAPLRQAAAQARAWLVAQAAEMLGAQPPELSVQAGVVSVAGQPQHAISFRQLVAGGHAELLLDAGVALKHPSQYQVIGRDMPRVDLPAKATGGEIFVHDVRVPGMLHGRVVRPPYAGVDVGDFIGNTLESVDRQSIAHIPGIVAVVVIRDFVGIVAEREEDAQAAMHALKVHWKPWPGAADLSDLSSAIRANPATPRTVAEHGDVGKALEGASQRLQRSYVWPYQMHASIGPSCAVADWSPTALKVWTGSQAPHVLRHELSQLSGLPDLAIDVVRLEAAGCYGRNCADDVAADAVLLSRAVGKPVRVQLTREQEHAWEPKGSAQLMEIDGGIDAEGRMAAYDFHTSQPSNGSPTLALLLTRTVEPVPDIYYTGDRTSVPPYQVPNLRVTINDMPPILRAAWLRGVSAMPNSFAHESYIDELATAAGVDPVEYRLRHLDDQRAIALVQATAQKAGWLPHSKPQGIAAEGDFLKGQGFAYARYFHSRFPGFGAAWAAWVADVEVNRKTGEVHVRRVVVGQDSGTMVNPAGVKHQIHGNVLQTASRSLLEQVEVDRETNAVAAQEWGSYPILSFRDVPVIEVLMMPRQGEPPLGVGESSSVPGTAAIANAIFDATGVRFRQPPFTPEVVREGLGLPELPSPPAQTVVQPERLPSRQPGPRRPWWTLVGALAVGGIGFLASLLGARTAIAPAAGSAGMFSAASIERGRQLAATGDCVACHTAPGGTPFTGGRALETPFGKIYTTNLTPDAATGLGSWSLQAFQRAMREGISRDGHHLYPAFPYTAFTRMTDDDLLSLYAYFHSMPAERNEIPAADLKFPFSMRPLMALWNAVYLHPGPVAADTTRSQLWNRGSYLVNGPAHCSACHTPRTALGAEKTGSAWLAGAMVEGWEAPGLLGQSRSPVPWTEDQLFQYLRFGHASQHGSASGPMLPVVEQLATVPEQDVRAMAHYLASVAQSDPVRPELVEGSARVQTVLAQSREQGRLIRNAGQRMFDSACGACHHDGTTPAANGLNLPLALNSNLHSDRPDNLVRVVLEGIHGGPASGGIRDMPAFRNSLSDAQVEQLARYMRARFAPGQPAWKDVAQTSRRIRQSPTP